MEGWGGTRHKEDWGVGSLKAVVRPHWGSDPTSGLPGAQKPPLGRGPPPPVWDAPGQRRGRLPSSVFTRHRAVKRDSQGAPLAQPPKGKEG